ncbi:unnamed protein product [Adineta ricciae]|uniref:C2H2-type domain-containing protein n=1 Tax=Adineta ricciae TaxID=249248 RepID=A0A813N4C6_ADIRI|nr:unnamed protein product [Adineta ricciae]CAF1644126.1 unnamed protein product [Adineta ricciae]
MKLAQVITDDEDNNEDVLDLSVKKKPSSLAASNEVILKQNQNLSSLLSPSSSSTSSSLISSPKHHLPTNKRVLDTSGTMKIQQTGTISSNKRPLRFQCKHCDYKAPSTSLMQNHIYRHTDLTPYACAYCGHKSTTKSTIMVHIELCHPNMEVKIIENRVREQDFYRDLNSSEITSTSNSSVTNPVTASTAATTAANTQEPQLKKQRCSNQYDSESAPINGVAISLKTIVDDDNESLSASDDTSETENLEPVTFENDEQRTSVNLYDSAPTMVKPSLKLKLPPPQMSTMESTPPITKESDSDDGSEYLLVYNRPKQYYGSLYEPDKQYACKLCSYTTNHRPSMEDHVFVHTNEKPYKCGYCGEEIYTRYAATYHIKYKHAGMPRNFIQNKADVTQYYVNRAKKDDEKNQFKVIDTRRVKVPARNGKSGKSPSVKTETSVEYSVQNVSSPSPSNISISTPPQTPISKPPLPPTTNVPTGTTVPPDYRLLLAWSYYLASQAAWLSPMLPQQQQGQLPSSLPTDPEAAAKFLQQAMQTAMGPLMAGQTANGQNDDDDDDQSKSEPVVESLLTIKQEVNES